MSIRKAAVKIRIHDWDYHRNGVCGGPFHVFLFDDIQDENTRKFASSLRNRTTAPSSTSPNWPEARSPSASTRTGATGSKPCCAPHSRLSADRKGSRYGCQASEHVVQYFSACRR